MLKIKASSCLLRKYQIIIALMIAVGLMLSAFPVSTYADNGQTYEKGDIITFGQYEQDNNTSNGMEPIRWIILGYTDNNMYVISENILDVKPYDTMNRDVTWDNCSLRIWLNGAFMRTAFSMAEQSIIATTTLENEDNPVWGSSGGTSTNDKVFFLSINAAETNFVDDESRKAECTPYALARGAEVVNDSYTIGSWWLRSSGQNRITAAYINNRGHIQKEGWHKDHDGTGVRPVIGIDSNQMAGYVSLDTGPALPDLVADPIRVDGEISPNYYRVNATTVYEPKSPILFDTGIWNVGNADPQQTFNIKWYINGYQVGYGMHEIVPAGWHITEGNTYLWWSFDPGTYYVEFVVDCDNYIQESDDSNNRSGIYITVGY